MGGLGLEFRNQGLGFGVKGEGSGCRNSRVRFRLSSLYLGVSEN